MCIMFVKHHDEEFPTDACMQVCWDDNRDGAGYSWYDKEVAEWVSVKGLMSWNAFLEKFTRDRDVYDLDNKTCIVHFRVGTSGPEVGGATHPFPATMEEGVDVNTLDFRSTGVFYHNGTIGHGNQQYSDTQIATNAWVIPLVHLIYRDIDNPDQKLMDILDTLLKTNDNRYVITYKHHMRILGKWVVDPVSKLKFSNNRFQEHNTRYYAAYTKMQNAWQTKTTTTTDTTTPSPLETSLNIFLPESVRLVDVFLDDKNYFMWDLWDKRHTITHPIEADATTDTNPTGRATQTTVYDEHGKQVFTITHDEYDTPDWDKTEAQKAMGLSDDIIVCPECGLVTCEAELIDGTTCKGCTSIIDRVGLEPDYECPTCDATMIIEYDGQYRMPGLGDYCECAKCGTIWGYNPVGAEWVIGYRDKKGVFTRCDENVSKDGTVG